MFSGPQEVLPCFEVLLFGVLLGGPVGPHGPIKRSWGLVPLYKHACFDISGIGLRRYRIIIRDVFCISAFVWLRTMAQKTVGINMDAGIIPLFFVRKSVGRTP